jgi:hypothetical protein
MTGRAYLYANERVSTEKEKSGVENLIFSMGTSFSKPAVRTSFFLEEDVYRWPTWLLS